MMKTTIFVTVCKMTSLIFNVTVPLSSLQLNQCIHSYTGDEKDNHFKHRIKCTEITQYRIDDILSTRQLIRIFKVDGNRLKHFITLYDQCKYCNNRSYRNGNDAIEDF